ncbi:MAG: dihydrofolate reductase family protein [Fimbriimonadaceae bacterium]
MEVPYANLEFPDPPADRPYVFVNMVTTIDGKIVTGERDEPVPDLGSKTDHAAMRNIEAAADAVLIGAGSLRATPGLHYAPHLKRIVMTRSGKIFFHEGKLRRFFSDAPERAFVATASQLDLPDGVQHLSDDPRGLLFALRREHGVTRLVIEGGSEINALFLAADLVDELFLTLAPKVKLGQMTPTYAGGEPLSRADIMRFDLTSCIRAENEIFLRYRRARST